MLSVQLTPTSTQVGTAFAALTAAISAAPAIEARAAVKIFLIANNILRRASADSWFKILILPKSRSPLKLFAKPEENGELRIK
jgi:hypothetical protein